VSQGGSEPGREEGGPKGAQVQQGGVRGSQQGCTVPDQEPEMRVRGTSHAMREAANLPYMDLPTAGKSALAG
jgi:hypothetical protein